MADRGGWQTGEVEPPEEQVTAVRDRSAARVALFLVLGFPLILAICIAVTALMIRWDRQQRQHDAQQKAEMTRLQSRYALLEQMLELERVELDAASDALKGNTEAATARLQVVEKQYGSIAARASAGGNQEMAARATREQQAASAFRKNLEDRRQSGSTARAGEEKQH
jgi:hypothetical protein